MTAFVVGFVIEEQERGRHPAGYETTEPDSRLGNDVPLVKQAGRARHDHDPRFDRQLAMIRTGLAQELQ